MSASDKSNGTQPALPYSSDTGPTSPDGEMLLPTPRNQMGAAEQPSAKRAHKGGGRPRRLEVEVPALLPTPSGFESDPTEEYVEEMREAFDPQARMYLPGRKYHAQRTLRRVAALLPTPRAGKTTDEDEESWSRRQDAGGVATPPLSLAVKSISSVEDSPASRSASQGDEEARMTTDTSGRSSDGSSLRWNPATWSSRTSLVCSLQDGEWVIEQGSLFGTTPLATFSETYPRWGSMHDGQVFAHPTPERVTEESASSSSLGTPTAQTGGDSPEHGHELLGPQIQRQMLHTPTTGDTAPTYDHRASPGYTRAIPVPNLAAQVNDLLPTPTARDLKGERKTYEPGPLLPEVIGPLSRGDHTKPQSEGGNE